MTRQEAPALVLSEYRPSFDPQVCGYGSSPSETIAKLAFLQQQGVQAKVSGISQVRLGEAGNSALVAAIAPWLSTKLPLPQLLEVPPRCELVLSEAWLAKLIKTPMIGWGIPAESVQVIEVPGHAQCGLVISGSVFAEYSVEGDSFYGPWQDGRASCPDSPNDSEIWIESAVGIQLAKTTFPTRGKLFGVQMKDVQLGKMYLLASSVVHPRCGSFLSLPHPYEWQAGALHPAKDARRFGRVLAEQCEELTDNREFECRGFLKVPDSELEPPQGGSVLAALRQGGAVSVISLIDTLGAERRQAYAAAIASGDREAHRRLVVEGIPPHWSVAEMVSLSQSGLPLAEKRRRIALMFSVKEQLALALNSKRYDLPEALLPWLPRQDWGPVWRVIGQQPDIWWDAAGRLRTKASEKGRKDLLCDIDRAQGFLCGGGIEFD